MAQSMHLIVLKDTGHVLGVLSGIAFAVDPKLEDVCGTSFPVGGVRTKSVKGDPGAVLVPRELLELKTVPHDPAVIAACRDYLIAGSHLTRIAPPGTLPTITLDADKVNLPGLAEKTMVVVSGAADPATERRVGLSSTTPFTPVVLGALPDGAVPAPVDAGADCMVMVASQGKPVRVDRQTA